MNNMKPHSLHFRALSQFKSIVSVVLIELRITKALNGKSFHTWARPRIEIGTSRTRNARHTSILTRGIKYTTFDVINPMVQGSSLSNCSGQEGLIIVIIILCANFSRETTFWELFTSYLDCIYLFIYLFIWTRF